MTLALSSTSRPCKFAISVLLVSGLSKLCTSPSSKGPVKPVRLLHHLTFGSNSLSPGTGGPVREPDAGSPPSPSSSSWITSAWRLLSQVSLFHGAFGNALVELVAITAGALDGVLLVLGLVHFALLACLLCSSDHWCLRLLLGVGDLSRFLRCIRLTESSWSPCVVLGRETRSGFNRVKGLGLRVRGLGFKILGELGFGLRVTGLGFRVKGLVLRV